MQGLLTPGSLRPSAGCCANGCACCGGGGGLICCEPPDWSTLADGDPVSTISEPVDPCVWLLFGVADSLTGTGAGRVDAEGDTTAHYNITQVTTPTGCLGAAVTSYTPANGDDTQLALAVVAGMQAISDGTNTDIRTSPFQGSGLVSIGTFAGTTHDLEIQVCGGNVVYLVDGAVEQTLAVALFPAIQTAIAAHVISVYIAASRTSTLGPVTTDCTPTVPTEDFLQTAGGDDLLTAGGDQLLVST